MVEVIQKAGADAVLVASLFHYREYTLGEAKAYLAGRGVPVRL
jgi:cyclase